MLIFRSQIAEWAADTAPNVLAQLEMAGAVPSESTIRRCLQKLAPDQLDNLLGAWTCLRTSVIGGRRVIAFDGKTLRGAKDAAGTTVVSARIRLVRAASPPPPSRAGPR